MHSRLVTVQRKAESARLSRKRKKSYVESLEYEVSEYSRSGGPVPDFGQR
jgi:hypothetical protein